MARCNECNSIITKEDSECYICGQVVPGAKRFALGRKKEPKPVPPVTPLSNLLFIVSLALTVVSFLLGEKMSIAFSATLSSVLLIARIFADRIAAKEHS